jgi:uncharacterized protein (DUF924 family)
MMQRLFPEFAAGPAALLDAAYRPAPHAEVLPVPPPAAAVAAFWREAGPDRWFAKDPGFDRDFADRFAGLHDQAARAELSHWLATTDGALALILLLDQYPRNAFRDTARMYATDPLARQMADGAIRRGHDRRIDRALVQFFYLPFAHSERLEDQVRAVTLCSLLGEPEFGRAGHHRDIILRFGRFPHRNTILGRDTTLAEQRWLDEGGFKG